MEVKSKPDVSLQGFTERAQCSRPAGVLYPLALPHGDQLGRIQTLKMCIHMHSTFTSSTRRGPLCCMGFAVPGPCAGLRFDFRANEIG
jgi:hypothetical protein